MKHDPRAARRSVRCPNLAKDIQPRRGWFYVGTPVLRTFGSDGAGKPQIDKGCRPFLTTILRRSIFQVVNGPHLFTFIELPVFVEDIDSTGSLDILYAIQADLLEDPERGAVIPGTGGLRKARVADKRKKKGKSGSYRYMYLYLKHAGVIYLILLFAKSDFVNISEAQKKELARISRDIKLRYK
ncbi:MAG: hypothetical protein DWQ47_10855 [Acidobacteria bacterium]|nr:MAG: hypothetical protein DWQ32_13270 [Acidobacteriota bacterium]REJ98082.1 MAG: hypothetical protein DWQ38_16070 [Acidobacteriota bacterium]REK16825.1 MAG: hypothetical protein DWQ43_01115 [Acidobacteriota bacterium]REK42736.1 MAG: hypothetical protein DWQ47_10855 [Acidobacteriota bacterium]